MSHLRTWISCCLVTWYLESTRFLCWQSWRPGAPDCLPPHCDAVQRALRSTTPPLCLFNGRGSAPPLKPSGTTLGLATHTHKLHTLIKNSCFIMYPRSFTAERHSSSIKRGSDFVFLFFFLNYLGLFNCVTDSWEMSRDSGRTCCISAASGGLPLFCRH